jgi:hypothetical protein
MRHFLVASAVPGLASRVVKPARTALLIETAGPLQRDPPRVACADARAVAVSAVADPAQEEELLAVRADADDQPQRIHALPRSGRGGWTTTRRCAKKGAANRALPSVGFRQRVRGVATPDPHPSASSAGTIYLNPPRLRNRARRVPVANSALFGDRQHQGLATRDRRTRTQAQPRYEMVFRRLWGSVCHHVKGEASASTLRGE